MTDDNDTYGISLLMALVEGIPWVSVIITEGDYEGYHIEGLLTPEVYDEQGVHKETYQDSCPNRVVTDTDYICGAYLDAVAQCCYELCPLKEMWRR